MMNDEERYEYAAVLHKLVMAYDHAQMAADVNPYPGLSDEAWALLIRDYGGAPLLAAAMERSDER